MLHDKIHYILFIETHARLLRLNTFDDSPLLPDPNVFIYAVSLRNSFMFCLWESGFWSGYFKPRCFSYYSVLNLILSASFRLFIPYVTYKLLRMKPHMLIVLCCVALSQRHNVLYDPPGLRCRTTSLLRLRWLSINAAYYYLSCSVSCPSIRWQVATR